MTTNDRETMGRALGRIPSGLFVVTVRKAGAVSAFLGSWVQQAGFDPPMISMAVKTGRPAQALLDEGATFAVNVIPAGPTPLLKHFVKGFAPGEDPYAGIAVERGTTGVEVLPGALAVLECKVKGSVDAGDHVVYLGEVCAARMRDGGGEPAVHLRRNGFGY
jgi:flavin reductase (DIM6/NTAB) family NADH-FMN oxidoreductase RutF